MVENSSDSSPEETPVRDPFEVVSIRSVDTPKGLTGADWHRYEICQGHNQIVGFRAGDIANVTLAVEDIVDRLNHRRLVKRGRTHVVLGPKSAARSS
jgi:hypothetical protein